MVASKKYFNLLAIFAIWIYALVMVVPTMSGKYGSFGYNPESGKCDYKADRNGDPRIFLYSVGFAIPFLLIVIGNLGIWKVATKPSRSLIPCA